MGRCRTRYSSQQTRLIYQAHHRSSRSDSQKHQISKMSSSYVFVVLAILAITFPIILATDFIVGDDKGWTINVDYQGWAQGKLFYVGDNLIFNYPEGAHSVLKVNGTGFQECAAPAGTVALTSGQDVINLATPGRKWYICGVGKHCEIGPQKLFITVMPTSYAPSPSPTTSAATTSAVNGARIGWMVIGIAILGMLI